MCCPGNEPIACAVMGMRPLACAVFVLNTILVHSSLFFYTNASFSFHDFGIEISLLRTVHNSIAYCIVG